MTSHCSRSSVGRSSSNPSKPSARRLRRLAQRTVGQLVAGAGGDGDGVDLDRGHSPRLPASTTRRAPSPTPSAPRTTWPPCPRWLSPSTSCRARCARQAWRSRPAPSPRIGQSFRRHWLTGCPGRPTRGSTVGRPRCRARPSESATTRAESGSLYGHRRGEVDVHWGERERTLSAACPSETLAESSLRWTYRRLLPDAWSTQPDSLRR